MRVGLMGCGHMGRLHARTVQRSGWSSLAWVCDVDADAARTLGEALNVPWFVADPGDGDLVLVATPATTHRGLVDAVLGSERWCFVEKPLAVDADEELGGERLLVGHSERFNPAWTAGAHLLGDEVTVVRQGPRTGRNEDVDAVLDLMVHDLDLLLQHSADAEVVEVRGDGQHCDASLRTRAGRTFCIRAHRGADAVQRTWHSTSALGEVQLDLAQQALAINARNEVIPRWDILDAQWQAVGARIRGEHSAVASAEEGVRVLRLAQEIRRALAS